MIPLADGTCSKDPIGYEGSKWNLFEYANSAPSRWTDPTGESIGKIIIEVCKRLIGKGTKPPIVNPTPIKRPPILGPGPYKPKPPPKVRFPSPKPPKKITPEDLEEFERWIDRIGGGGKW